MPAIRDGNDQLAAVFPTARYLEGVRHAELTTKLAPAQKQKARRLLAEFLEQCEWNNADIDYSQHRPFDPTVDPNGFVGDCSSYITQAFRWLQARMPTVRLRDPNGVVEWDGYGFTGTLLATNHGHRIPRDHKVFVGDMAIYGRSFSDTRHVTICRVNGTASTAVFSSHGSSRGPRKEGLFYRSDLLGVYRPVSLL